MNSFCWKMSNRYQIHFLCTHRGCASITDCVHDRSLERVLVVFQCTHLRTQSSRCPAALGGRGVRFVVSGRSFRSQRFAQTAYRDRLSTLWRSRAAQKCRDLGAPDDTTYRSTTQNCFRQPSLVNRCLNTNDFVTKSHILV